MHVAGFESISCQQRQVMMTQGVARRQEEECVARERKNSDAHSQYGHQDGLLMWQDQAYCENHGRTGYASVDNNGPST